MRQTVRLLWATGLLTCSPFVFSHYPMMECIPKDQQVECRVGFSDGSKAIGKPVRVFDYDENLLQEYKADKRSLVLIDVPKGEFYIQFDSGHEFPVEVDYGEL